MKYKITYKASSGRPPVVVMAADIANQERMFGNIIEDIIPVDAAPPVKRDPKPQVNPFDDGGKASLNMKEVLTKFQFLLERIEVLEEKVEELTPKKKERKPKKEKKEKVSQE